MQVSEVQSSEAPQADLGCRAVMCVGGHINDARSVHTLKMHRIASDFAEKGDALIITTPHSEYLPGEQIASFQRVHDHIGRFRVTYLNTEQRDIPFDESREKIQNASIIYVPGGQTGNMFHKWERHDIRRHIDHALRHQSHTVYIGSSAGSIVPFSLGLSATAHLSKPFKERKGWARGLGLFPAYYSPHIDEVDDEFELFFAAEKAGSVGMGIKARCGLVRHQGGCTIVAPDRIDDPVVLYEKLQGFATIPYPLQTGDASITGLLEKAIVSKD